jgi:hypothetical protein
MRAAGDSLAGSVKVFLIVPSSVRMAALAILLVQPTVALAAGMAIDLPQGSAVASLRPELTHNGRHTTVDEARHEQCHA